MPNNAVYYPHFTPILLTDTLFTEYGGITGSSTAAQRRNAYIIAEERVSAHLGTFLTPTIVTGTYNATNPILVDHAHVSEILAVRVYSRDGNTSCTFTISTACAYLFNALRGIVDINYYGNCSGCSDLGGERYLTEIAYRAGIPSGTSYHPNILNALTIIAQSELNEWGLASINEAPGDVGVQSYSNQDYQENRVWLKRTALGTSAASNHAERLLRRFVVRRRIGL